MNPIAGLDAMKKKKLPQLESIPGHPNFSHRYIDWAIPLMKLFLYASSLGTIGITS
jgi:hypothetical protein